jgi:hypothetical protein
MVHGMYDIQMFVSCVCWQENKTRRYEIELNIIRRQ